MQGFGMSRGIERFFTAKVSSRCGLSRFKIQFEYLEVPEAHISIPGKVHLFYSSIYELSEALNLISCLKCLEHAVWPNEL
jgi:hypothetical protein